MHFLIYALVAYAFWAISTICDKMLKEETERKTLLWKATAIVLMFAGLALVYR
jgi:uncharacterized membrane protein